MNTEKAAQALVECGYADAIRDDRIAIASPGGADGSDVQWDFQRVDPINNEAQRQALLEWFKVSAQWINGGWQSESPDRVLIFGRPKRTEAENACLEEILK